MSVSKAPRQLAQVTLGCVVLGVGVAMLLTADLGSDGFSTLVNGVSITTGTSFLVANLLISLLFLAVAALRKVFPGLGTAIQVVVVGWTVSVLIELLDTPADLPWRLALLAAALPVLAVGIAVYLGAQHRGRSGRGGRAGVGPARPVQVDLQPGPGRGSTGRLAARRDPRRSAPSP